MLTAELCQAQPAQEFLQMFPARLVASSVHVPHRRGDAQLRRDDADDGRMRLLGRPQCPTWKAQVHHQHRDAEAVVSTSMLTHKREVLRRQRGQTDQLALIVRKGEQLKTLRRRQKPRVEAWLSPVTLTQ
jgi:hypothetical protein